MVCAQKEKNHAQNKFEQLSKVCATKEFSFFVQINKEGLDSLCISWKVVILPISIFGGVNRAVDTACMNKKDPHIGNLFASLTTPSVYGSLWQTTKTILFYFLFFNIDSEAD